MEASLDYSAYPQRRPQLPNGLDKAAWALRGRFLRARRSSLRSLRRFARLVNAEGVRLKDASDASLLREAQRAGYQMRKWGFERSLAARSFALTREAARRTVGMTHYDVQLMGGYTMLQGQVAEMATGEGKTLTATLPACAAALAGIPCHVVSVNDYLSARDAEWMEPVYLRLGLSVGRIVHASGPSDRRAAYACDVTYTTNKELVFDYLRDRLTLGTMSRRSQLVAERIRESDARLNRLLLRGLHFAIVDEADSIFIDEARTPAILSSAPGEVLDAPFYMQAAGFARSLELDRDFRLDPKQRHVELTAAGKMRLAQITEKMGPFWTGPRRREEMAVDALMALHLFDRDKHYLIRESRIVMIDEYTGRAMPDRTWSLGLHQAIEAKEGCPVTEPPQTLAQISYQQFFRRYLRLAGMTGTALEVADELWKVYGLTVTAIPTHRPTNRRRLRSRLFATAAEKWQALIEHVRQQRDLGRPVLIGTRSVAASEELSRLMDEAGLQHCILNARQDEEEASIVARAGQISRITVATNMAGRGTDIKLGAGVAEIGGLHVVATERHEAGRIDRQLFGRGARQGDPGSCALFVSLEDELTVRFCPIALRFLARPFCVAGGWMSSIVEVLVGATAQWLAERTHRAMRRQVLNLDEQIRSALSFAGKSD